MNHSHLRRKRHSEGTSLVETAVVLPVFIIFVFGLIAYGHAQMVANIIKGATRTAVRYGATEGVSTSQAEARVRQIMSDGVDPAFITIQIKDASAYDNGTAFPSSATAMAALPDIERRSAVSRQLFMIRASINYNDVAILPVAWLNGVQLSGQAFMRHE
jgi:Flp pilus assembly protein TadG